MIGVSLKMNDYIYGKNAVLEALEKNPKRINKVYISQTARPCNRLKKIKELSRFNSIVISFTNLNSEKFEKEIPHQGVIASVAPVDYVDFEEFLEQKKDGYRKIVILDGVQDPHNFGAIIRTCACSGYDAVIVANHRSCPLNATVEKTSAGAINHVPIIKVNSLSGTIEILKKSDWWIIAADAHAKDNYFEIDYTDMNFALILGSEGSGITKTLMNKSDFQIKLPCNFESLNVSTACAVILYESVRQILCKNQG